MALFGGLEYYFKNLNGLKLKVEYDSDEYKGSGNSPKIKDSPINYGLTYPITDYLSLSAFYLRGNTFGFGFNITIDAGKERKKRRQNLVVKPATNDDEVTFYRSLLKNLNQNRMYLQAANLSKDTLKVTINQDKYLQHTLAADDVLDIIDKVAPESVKKIEVTEINGSLPLSKVTAYREHITKINEGFNSNNYLNYITFDSADSNFKAYKFRPKINFPIFNWNLGFNLRSHIGQPTNFLITQLKLAQVLI